MLDPMKIESVNSLNIIGILNEIDVTERTDREGRGFVTAKGKVRVDQTINGEVYENLIPFRASASRKKNNQEDNPIYDRIVAMKNDFISASAVDDIAKASRVYIGGNSASLEENLWVGRDGKVVSTPMIKCISLGKARSDENDIAEFELTGVIGKMIPETDSDGNETNRLIIKFIVVGYGGMAHCIDLIAEDTPSNAAKTFIENHWEEQDTVSLAGKIKWSYKVIEMEEEQGFGEPIKRHKTISCREFIITKGCPSGFDENAAYDPDLIAKCLEKREEKKQGQVSKTKTKSDSSTKVKKGTPYPDF